MYILHSRLLLSICFWRTHPVTRLVWMGSFWAKEIWWKWIPLTLYIGNYQNICGAHKTLLGRIRERKSGDVGSVLEQRELCYSSKLKIPAAAAAAAKSLQSCPTLCDPIDGSPPGSPIPGILQARILEWGAIAFSDTASPGKDKNSKFELWFLLNSSCFCTIGKIEKNH